MLCIRLQRTGNKNNPAYRLVVADKRNSAKKNPYEIIGHYLPTREPVDFEVQSDRVEHYLKNGAVPSNTVARLLAKGGVKNLEKFMKSYTKKKKRNAPEEEEAPAAPAAPAEEKKEEAPEAPVEDKNEGAEGAKDEGADGAEEKKEEEPAVEEEKKEE